MIKINNKKLHDYIVTKDDLVTEIRKIAKQMDLNAEKIHEYEEKEKKITGAVKPDKELVKKGDAIAEEFNRNLVELEAIGKEIESKKMEAIPIDIINDHKALLAENEKLDRDKTKLALKVQKVKDRIIPLIHKEVKPLLEEYEDIESAKAKDGEVVFETFNYLEDFKKRFHRRQK